MARLTQSELTAKLKAWVHEYAVLTQDSKVLQLPDVIYQFLSNRLVDFGYANDDPDVLHVDTHFGVRKLRVTGLGPQGHLLGKYADGGHGEYLFLPQQVRPDDRGKLSDLLERFMREGKIKDASARPDGVGNPGVDPVKD